MSEARRVKREAQKAERKAAERDLGAKMTLMDNLPPAPVLRVLSRRFTNKAMPQTANALLRMAHDKQRWDALPENQDHGTTE